MELKACPHKGKERFYLVHGEHRTVGCKCTCGTIDLSPFEGLVSEIGKAMPEAKTDPHLLSLQYISFQLRKIIQQMRDKE